MQIEDWNALKAFSDLIGETVEALQGASSQTTLGRVLDDVAPRWDGVDDEFAAILRDLRKQTWQVSFSQVRHVAAGLVEHLEAQKAAVDGQLRQG